MKKYIIHIVDITILILCFLFIISTYFKLVSWTALDNLVHDNLCVLIIVWIMGITLSLIFTRPLYQWILHLRHL